MLSAVLLAGCHDESVAPPAPKPAAPRGLQSVTGDHEAFLSWLPNTERDVVGYRVYASDCGDPDCLYGRVGSTTSNTFVVTGLTDGQTKYFAVSAVNADGRESELSYDIVYDTPRPEGTGLALSNYLSDSTRAGYDFSGYAVRSYSSLLIDIFYGTSGSQPLMIAPFTDTEIQDAGYATSLDAVDFAPTAGWSTSGTVELITGHCYVVWTHDNHYAKFRVVSVTPTRVVVDWAYQVATGNRELRALPEPGTESPRVRRAAAWAALTGPGGA